MVMFKQIWSRGFRAHGNNRTVGQSDDASHPKQSSLTRLHTKTIVGLTGL